MTGLPDIPENLPVLIAGPTASGKSSLALDIAQAHGGEIVNADALQIYDCWNVLSARPDENDLERAPHHFYGHVDWRRDYSVGDWLRDLSELLPGLKARPIIVGGTGLYFRALTEGLAQIPPTPPSVRAEADRRLADEGLSSLNRELDERTKVGIDLSNPKRVQRAWEVLKSTGRGIADWQAETPPPLLPLDKCFPIALEVDRDWLNARIDVRFEQMITQGALEEVRALLKYWDPSRLSAKAIGAAELVAHLQGKMTLEDAIELAKSSTRQYAKRQRTWIRARMGEWYKIAPPSQLASG